MKTVNKQSNKKAAFTIVELLTVMSIIVILMGLLLPALNMAKRYAKMVRQKAQFHSMDAAIELFNNEFDGYPESGAVDPTGLPYCGAMKLCEAMMGWDLLGFHTSSIFRRDGTNASDTLIYDPTDLAARRGPFLPLESANAYKLGDIYSDVGSFEPDNFVLCDVYTRRMQTQKKTGMPVLYYKANTANALHLYDVSMGKYLPPAYDDPKGNIYNYWDNAPLLMRGKPWEKGLSSHKLHEDPDATPPEPQGERFYLNTRNDKIPTGGWRPYRADSYILISAGWDGEYGTADDICNFDWKYQESIP